MAITFVGSTSASAGNGDDVTVTLSNITGLAQNDLVILSGGIADEAGIDITMALVSATGWTKISEADLFANDTYDCNLGVWYKVMGASPDTSVIVDGLGGANSSTTGIAMAFRGVDIGTPLDATTVGATGLSTFTPDPPSITFTDSNAWIVIATSSAHNLGGTITASHSSADYQTDEIYISQGDTADCTAYMGYHDGATSPEDPGTVTVSGTDSGQFSWCAATLALRAAAGTSIPIFMHHYLQNSG